MRGFWMLLLAAVVLVTPARAHAGPRHEHVAPLPRVSPGTTLGAVPGEPPGPRHPRGTVIVAASLPGCGSAVYEWDVAFARVVRQSCFGLGEGNVALARSASALQVLSNARSLLLSEVDPTSFRLEHRIDLGPAWHFGVATDGALTAVASDSDDSRQDEWSVAILGAGGHMLGRTKASGTLSHGPDVQVAVLSGRAFVVLAANPPIDPKPRLVALNADATVAKRIPLDTTVSVPPIAVKNGRLLVALGRELLELSPDLDVLARHPISLGGPLAVAPDGHLFTGEGDVYSDAFTFDTSVDVGEGWVHDVLWVGSTPILVGTAAEVARTARLHWFEP